LALQHYERLSFLVGLTAVGLGFSLLLEPPAIWVLAAVLAGVICGGTDGILRVHPRFGELHPWVQPVFWILPTLLTLGGGLLLLRIGWVGVGGYLLAAGLLVIVGVLAAVILAEYNLLNDTSRLAGVSRHTLQLATYLTAFALYAGLHFSNSRLPTYTSTGVIDLQLGGVTSQVVVALVSGLLALSLFSEARAGLRRALLYAAVTGLIMAETAWGLFYWPLGGLMAGAFLLLVFYFVSGVLYNHMAGRLNQALFLEFGLVTAVGFAILYGVQTWMG